MDIADASKVEKTTSLSKSKISHTNSLKSDYLSDRFSGRLSLVNPSSLNYYIIIFNTIVIFHHHMHTAENDSWK